MARELPDWIDTYLQYTDNSEPRESYRTWAAISTIAACLQRKVYLPWGTLTIFPNMYIVLVGPPAARKGTAMLQAKPYLNKIGITFAADESSRQKLIDTLENSAATVNDKTSIYTHSSLTIFASELTVFLGYNNLELISCLNKWFDCEDPFRYETKHSGSNEVRNVWVNLFGATTPTLLQTSVPREAAGSGLTSRTIFVYEDGKGKVVHYPGLSPEEEALEKPLVSDLERINALSGRYKFTDSYMKEYVVWRDEAESTTLFDNMPALEYYEDRRPLHILKLSMIMSASRGGDLVLRAEDFKRANKILSAAETKMPRVFSGIGANPMADVQVRIMEAIGFKGEMTLGDLMDIFISEVDAKQLYQSVCSLHLAGYCDLVKTEGSYANWKVVFKRGGRYGLEEGTE